MPGSTASSASTARLPEERAPFHELAAHHGLAPTGGSDYHGENKPGLSVGTGRGDLRVPDEYLDGLEAGAGLTRAEHAPRAIGIASRQARVASANRGRRRRRRRGGHHRLRRRRRRERRPRGS